MARRSHQRTRTIALQCVVNSGWTLVGGGAEIENEVATGSRVLKASFPLQDVAMNTWVARSNGTESHRVRAHVIGIKLFGLTETQVRSLRDIRDSTTASAVGTQSITQQVQSGYTMVGGGAVVLVPTSPGYLIESRPSATDTWKATINSTGSGAGVKVYAISLATCPSSWSAGCLSQFVQESTGGSASGYGSSAFSPAHSPWIQTSIGAKANKSSGTGQRYLADLIPLNGANQGVTVRSFNVGTASGTTVATSVNLRLFAYPWNSNTVQFNSGGALYRGSNGQLQRYVWPQTTQHHWAFQETSTGSNRWYLRNGNPGYGGDCAYQTSGATTVSIGSTCSGTGYEWEVFTGAFNGSVILKNRLTAKCLDTNGQGSSSPTDVVTATCSTSNGNQYMWLDWYSWP